MPGRGLPVTVWKDSEGWHQITMLERVSQTTPAVLTMKITWPNKYGERPTQEPLIIITWSTQCC